LLGFLEGGAEGGAGRFAQFGQRPLGGFAVGVGFGVEVRDQLADGFGGVGAVRGGQVV
jgi:hypothetical protein